MNRLLDQCRRKGSGKAFRKQLGMFNHKVKEYGMRPIRSPGVIPLDVKVKLLKVETPKEKGDHHSLMKIKDMERNSHYPYGKFNSYGKSAVIRQILL